MVIIQKGYKDWIDEPKRARSGEVDFGVWWTLAGNEREFPRWRVSWIKDTGELYACQPAKDKLIVLGVIPERQAVEQVLEDWGNSEIYHNLKALARRVEALESVQTNG
jgi:hypothetical protein